MPENVEQRGTYTYLCNGEPAPVREWWRRSSADGDTWEVSSGREAGDVTIEVQARQVGARVEAFSAQWRSEARALLSIDYALCGNSVEVRRCEGDEAPRSERLALSGQACLFPLMRIFVGPVIRSLEAVGGEGHVIVPEIGVSPDSPELFKPNISERRVHLLEEHSASDSRELCCYAYEGGQYDDNARFWLGEDGLLERYRWHENAQQEWDVRLFRE